MSVEKRPAFEPPALLAEPDAAPATMRRPAATVFGALLVVLRVIAGVVWLASLALQWDRILRDDLHIEIEGASEAEAAEMVLVFILVFGRGDPRDRPRCWRCSSTSATTRPGWP